MEQSGIFRGKSILDATVFRSLAFWFFHLLVQSIAFGNASYSGETCAYHLSNVSVRHSIGLFQLLDNVLLQLRLFVTASWQVGALLVIVAIFEVQPVVARCESKFLDVLVVKFDRERAILQLNDVSGALVFLRLVETNYVVGKVAKNLTTSQVVER